MVCRESFSQDLVFLMLLLCLVSVLYVFFLLFFERFWRLLLVTADSEVEEVCNELYLEV